MNSISKKGLLAISSLAAILSLGACDRFGATAERAGDRTEQSARNAADETKSMGAAGVQKVDDATITSKVNAALAADKDLSAVKIDVDTKNGVVTLSGPAPSAEAASKATKLAKDVNGVTSVNNKLTVKAG